MKSCWIYSCLGLLFAGAAVLVYIATESSTPQEKEQNRLIQCAGLHLSDRERNIFYNAILSLKERRDWLILVDPQHRLPADYKPNDLTVQFHPHWPKKAQLRQEAFEQMNLMAEAAKKDGITLIPISTYRTWKYQKMLKDRKPDNPYVARAGESQHHLGTAVDFNTVNPSDENIPPLAWLRKHAGEYGFSLSFPKGKDAEKESGYPYEAWHYRYITRKAVQLQDDFFDGDQHKTLTFLYNCVFNTPSETESKRILPN
ncbi:MAG: M15 family metallopeptidase [Candidatus Avelusimicrobium sp.]|uniref:M15 family metallopeptidase n=1 Tax=Candidatus Avelusimicrobium sp. TaxID=3048833 RepID=UPI003F121D7B